MEIQTNQIVPHMGQTAAQAAPPPPVADTRPTADTAAVVHDATPETPLPIPPRTTQQGLVGQLMIKDSEDTARSKSDGPVQEGSRTLKPYGVAMLPGDTPDAPDQLPE